ncbi:hypothetical protein B0T17DRAFT_407583 [Bombardia bombarda]|uniref:Uncharacterized protein n=1 Tax=Bombardia bombarda TaxID=252184 RepID=A0AA39W4T7_9PEZI|nr:hypothetical protein B0T17DRAFT_407583 [Bombardia bombarda]
MRLFGFSHTITFTSLANYFHGNDRYHRHNSSLAFNCSPLPAVIAFSLRVDNNLVGNRIHDIWH